MADAPLGPLRRTETPRDESTESNKTNTIHQETRELLHALLALALWESCCGAWACVRFCVAAFLLVRSFFLTSGHLELHPPYTKSRAWALMGVCVDAWRA